MDDSKANEEGPGRRYIRGYVLRYGEVDRDGDVFLPGSIDLSSYLSAPSDRKPFSQRARLTWPDATAERGDEP